MVPALRKAFNDAFTKEKYQAFLNDLNSFHPGAIEFRLAETPVFISKSFGRKIIEACEYIIDFILDSDFKKLTERSIPAEEKVPGENSFPQMLIFDFAICTNSDGEPEPQLIEMQGFPSLYGFQVLYPDLISHHFPVPANYSQYLGDKGRDGYLELLRSVLLGPYPAENVILLEIKPHEQKTRIDFYCTRDLTGIQPVCITELIQEGKDVFYLLNGKKTHVKR
ncbi:MAG: hypothetical protein ABI687_07145, partial [Flavitalea sp.]